MSFVGEDSQLEQCSNRRSSVRNAACIAHERVLLLELELIAHKTLGMPAESRQMRGINRPLSEGSE